MDRRRPAIQTNPPMLQRAGGDHGARVAYWPIYDVAPLAADGRLDHHVYVRRELVRAWLAQHPTPPQSPLDTAEPVVRERGGIVRAGLARAARALRMGWAAVRGWW